MKESDVVLTPVPQADGRFKNRPAILLREMPDFGDFLVCGISTQLQHKIEDFDEIVSLHDNDFVSSGLVATSLIRLGFLAVLPRKQVSGSIGEISRERHSRLLNTLAKFLIVPTK